MAVEIQKIDPLYPHSRLLRHATRILEQGGVIVYPTDTIYGMGADILQKQAIDRLFKIKKASKHKLLSLICSDLKGISEWAFIPDYAFRIMRRITPGPFTFILKANKNVPKLLLQNRPTIGVRIPDSLIVQRLVEYLGRPLLNTSVPMGEAGFDSNPDEIACTYRYEIDLILDSGISSTIPSTIVDFTGSHPLILREGAGDPSLVL